MCPISIRIIVAAVFAFTISMGEFGATSLIARPERPTMPVAIGRFLSQPGALNQGQALAMSTLLMLVAALVGRERMLGLYELAIAGRHSVVVSGTHGKTSSTAMAVAALRACGRDPSFIVGTAYPATRRAASDASSGLLT